ncbi:MAG: HD family phosphohydrolase, partial [Deltaproteobacteria bacterium]|nr:HD family phosphohydrolase [Deltaproteobacteria bacterium]
VVIDYYHNRDQFKSPAIELNLSNDPIWSSKILEAVVNKKTARIEDMKTLNDFKLLQISWAFDLNFAPSFQAVEHRKYLRQIEATLPQSPDIEDAVAMAHGYVKSHL